MFLSNGDYSFPFDAALYWLKHLFVWSFQNGAPNLDGIIRLPGRLGNLLIFELLGNMGVSYFYLVASLLVVFFGFLYFARRFLQIKSWPASIVVTLLFAINPITLGNLAKVGLVMAVGLLPICLVMVRQFFVTGQYRYMLIYLILLNLSLIHPFTFTVNLIISGGYFLYLAIRNRSFIGHNWLKLGATFLLAFAMNLYFLLPVIALGSVDKSVISGQVASQPNDYTMLVDIANTSGLANSFALAKDVLKDFEFAKGAYLPVYFISVFALYGLLIGLYLYTEKRLSLKNKRIFIGSLAVVLLLILLSTGITFNIDAIIKFLINQPGGWIFRSPLKWQLYIPLFLCVSLAVLLKNLPVGWVRRGVLGAIVVLLLGMNGYLASDVIGRLFIPRTVSEFAKLQQLDLEGKTLLSVTSEPCSLYAQNNPATFTELNQVLASKNIQVKTILTSNLDGIGLGSYDYILSCQGSASSALEKNLDFELQQSFSGGALELYGNKSSKPSIYAVGEIFSVSNFEDTAAKQSLVDNVLNKEFHFVDETEERQSIGLYDAFGGLNLNSLKDGSVVTTVIPNNDGLQKLLKSDNSREIYYKKEEAKFTLVPNPTEGFAPLPHELSFDAEAGKSVEFHYTDPSFQYNNIMPNYSLEDGLWQKEVADCNAYDNSADISMEVDKKEKTDGRQSLRLEAQRHIACTGPDDITVEPGAHYLLSFDYSSSHPMRAGYHVGFNDSNHSSVSERLGGEHADWQQFDRVISVPDGADKLRLGLYAYPNDAVGDREIANYDNLKLIKVPDLKDSLYVVSNAATTLLTPDSVNFTTVNPTLKDVQVRGVRTPFYLVVRETYHSKWRLALNNSKVNSLAGKWLPAGADAVDGREHFKINGNINAWYVDPAALCQGTEGCVQRQDGSYDLDLLVEFAPQRWLYIGGLISLIAWLGALGYVVFSWSRQLVTRLRGGHGKVIR